MGGSIANGNYNASDWQLSRSDQSDFTYYLSRLFNTWVGIGFCPLCSPMESWAEFQYTDLEELFVNKTDIQWWYTGDEVYIISTTFVAVYFVCAALLLVAGVVSTIIEGRLVVPDVLGYASSSARNSRYLTLPKTGSSLSGAERVRKVGDTVVMMQDVKAVADVGRIALGNKHDNATRLRPGRLYR